MTSSKPTLRCETSPGSKHAAAGHSPNSKKLSVAFILLVATDRQCVTQHQDDMHQAIGWRGGLRAVGKALLRDAGPGRSAPVGTTNFSTAVGDHPNPYRCS